MNQKTVLFRASASAKIGGGHIIRCIALANQLRNIGWDCSFAVGLDTERTIPSISEFNFIALDEDRIAEEPDQIRKLLGYDIDLLIVDHYHRDKSFEYECRQWATKIMALDDLPNRHHDVDILLDQSGGRQAKEYLGWIPDTCKPLIGPNYALLRPDFQNFYEQKTLRADLGNFRIFVSMGATDQTNLTKSVLNAISDVCPNVETDVMLSSKAPFLHEIKNLCRETNRFFLHVDAQSPADIMSKATLGIGTGGINQWERCALGIPSLSFIAAENQRSNAVYLAQKGGGMLLGDDASHLPDILERTFQTIVSDPTHIERMSAAARSVCDGNGAERIANEISHLLDQPE